MRNCPQCQQVLVSSTEFQMQCDAYCTSCNKGWMTLKQQNEYWTPREVRFEMWRACPAFCPDCLSVPLDEGHVESSSPYLASQDVLQCSQCLGVYLSQLEYPKQPQIKPSHSALPSSPPPRSQEPVPSSPPEEEPPLPSVSEALPPEDSGLTLTPVEALPKERAPSSYIPVETPKPLPPLNRQKRDPNPLPDSQLSSQEMIWLGILTLSIILSLLYWMNP